jgi:signal peptidase I
LVFALVCATLWFTVGPAQLGGPVYYVIVDGSSMEPTYREGDLVLARAKASYAVGDVVAYLPDIGQRFPVIHRVVGMEGEGQYITQGDNRAQPDGWLATHANIFGAAWLYIPYGGSVIDFLRQPATWLAVAIGLVGLGLIAGARHGRARTGGRKRGRHVRPYALLPGILILFAFSANAANVTVDGGVLQAFQIEAGPDLRVEPGVDVSVEPGVDLPVEPRLDVPVSNAGEDQSVTIGSAVALDGRGSTDPGGNSMAYAWALTVPAGSAATLDDATSATPRFIADVAGTYTAELTVNDGRLTSPPDTVVVIAIQSVPATSTTTTVPDTTTTVPDTTTTVPDTTTTVPDTTTTVPDTTTTVPDTTTTVASAP